jgi:tetratricopeptide (TPR) repeat protein
LVAALEWVNDNPKLQLQLAGALCWFWLTHSYFAIGLKYLENVILNYKNRDAIYARGLAGLGNLLSFKGNFDDALKWLKKGLALWRELDDKREIGLLLTYISIFYLHYTTEYTEGRKCIDEAVEVLEKYGDPYLLLRARILYAYVFIFHFQVDQAEPLVLENLKTAHELKMQWDALIAQHMFGDCAIMKENYVESEKRYGKAVQMGVEIGDIFQATCDMQGVAMSLAGQGRFKKAFILNGAALAKFEEFDASLDAVGFWNKLKQKTFDPAQEEIGEDAVAELEKKGRQMGFENAVKYALDFDKD